MSIGSIRKILSCGVLWLCVRTHAPSWHGAEYVHTRCHYIDLIVPLGEPSYHFGRIDSTHRYHRRIRRGVPVHVVAVVASG